MHSPTKSCSLDPIPTFLVNECFDILIQPITGMVNLSFIDGIFIDLFKQTIVMPLIKKPSLSKNYRFKELQTSVWSSFHFKGCSTRSC